ncbi:TPA: hypothetical protein EYP70_00870 [Candidatus Bathyarchaeota archaeon]|nr:hypothetical protein [Candidatus Bathyarchaeota archaeon]
MSSWKYSFELVLRELDLAKKRKKALDDLYNAGKISRSTYEHIERELTEVMIDLEAHLGSLADKMNARAKDLENQMKTLEVFLANLEIHYAADEIDEETYTNQSRAINLGLEATRKELESIKTSLSKISAEAPKVEEKPAEAPKEAEVQEKTEEAPAETVTETPTKEAPASQEMYTPAPETSITEEGQTKEAEVQEQQEEIEVQEVSPSRPSKETSWGSI